MDIDEQAQGEQKKVDEEAAPEGQGEVDQPTEAEGAVEEAPDATIEECQGEAAETTHGQATDENTKSDDAKPMEVDLTGDDDAEDKSKKKPSAEKPKPPSVPEGSPKPTLTELEKAAAEAKAHYEELSFVDEKTGRIVVRGRKRSVMHASRNGKRQKGWP